MASIDSGVMRTLPLLPACSQPCLAFCRYQAQATQLDLLLYLSQLLPPATGRAAAVRRELRIHTAAALCPADPVLAAQLAEQELPEPAMLAVQVATWQQERNWQPPANDGNHPEAWACGQLGYADGQPEWHLCAPQAAALAARIRQALWLAQVRVLLPWLEQQRWRLLHQPELRRYFEQELAARPYIRKFDNSLVHEVEKLEPSHILEVLERCGRPQTNPISLLRSQTLRDQIALLRDCRNKLSHLAPLENSKIEEAFIQFIA